MPGPDEQYRFRIGADENGLGPRLGPMVVTAVLARVTDAGWKVVGKAAKGKLSERLGDSKQLVSHGNVALGEAWARALLRRGAGRTAYTDGPPDELLHALSPDDRSALRAPCPGHVQDQCWSAAGEELLASDAMVKIAEQDLDSLEHRGVAILGVRSVVLCAKRMNEGLDAGKNRFVLDLNAMERLVLELRAIAGHDVTAVCGKVGGFGKYGRAFGPLAGQLHSVIEEGQARSAYHFPGVGEIGFVRDADASDLCVSMASLVGKYVREALMARVVRFYRGELPALPDASGYYDPVTTTFIEGTRLLRKSRDIPEVCFERRGAVEATPSPVKAPSKAKRAAR
jgi:ribonuclease HII